MNIGKIARRMVLAGVMMLGAFPVHSQVYAAAASEAGINYRQAMVDLIAELHTYAAGRNADFVLLSNNGLSLLNPEENPQSSIRTMSASIGGVLTESCHYGWDMQDDTATPDESKAYMLAYTRFARQQGLPLFNIDYCFTRQNVLDAYAQNKKDGLTGFIAQRRQLDRIPAEIQNVNNRNCRSLKEAGNFLVLLNPEKFSSKAAYISALQATNYDLLIIDLIYGDSPLNREDLKLLKKKANGGQRLVMAYMSIGEAEDYRSYWQPEWKEQLPEWIDARNEEWSGNFKVKYWMPEWKALLYGSQDAYIDQILASGFDGAFLDIVDAYEYFQDKQKDS